MERPQRRTTLQKSVLLFLIIIHLTGVCLASPGVKKHEPPSESRGSRTVEMRVQFEVQEELPPGTFVGKIPTRPGFTYRFNEDLAEFSLNATSGEIRTAQVIDREKVLDGRFDFVVLSSQPKHPVEVRVLIIDVNDNSPIFPEPEVAVSFSESANAGTRVFLDTAEDADAGVNGVTELYKIIGGNEEGHFRLDVTSNPSGEAPFLHLETSGRLDRETKGIYRLNISAQDGGSPPRFGYLLLTVTVEDVNDCHPIFDHSDYVVSLNESVEIGSAVLQVRATDNDDGDNARLTYYLADTETQFSVEPDTGEILTTQRLNCQQNCPNSQPSCPKSCVFTVFARDHGVPSQDGRTYVTVNLLDSNVNHDPVIRFRYFPATVEAATVDENAQNGTVVAVISVIDPDEGPNGQTTVSITSGNELRHFRLESTPSFQLVRVNDVLDREKIGKYNLTVHVLDQGTPARSSTAFLLITINDVNDFEPVFDKSEYSTSLRELVPLGTFVVSLTARDEDTGINSQVFYSIVSGNDKLWFRIDPISGLITVAAALDRESQDTVRLKVSARDGGPNPKWSYTDVKITIADENDEIPKFLTETELEVELGEDGPVGTLIATIAAMDSDQGTNGSISYALAPQTEDDYPGFFHLDSSSGKLFSRMKFDRETRDRFEIRVIAKDHGTPPLSSTATIHLTISDQNDNSPKIYPTHYFIPLDPATTAVKSVIGRVLAMDPDEGLNAQLKFSIISGNEDGLLAIGDATGELILKEDLRSINKRLIQVGVSVVDGGGRMADESATVEILINSPDQKIIKFKQEMFNFAVVEDFGPIPRIRQGDEEMKEIGRVELMTATTTKDNLKYSILSGDINQTFTIDETSGVLRARKMDRETTNLYTLTILARQGVAFGFCRVRISVKDVNDFPPIYKQRRVSVRIEENSALGTEIYQTSAQDPDEGANSIISYSLIQNPNEMFAIDPANGLITLNKRLEYSPESPDEIQIEVMAKDSGSPSLSSKQSISVTIIDINDHTPVFDHSSYETSLLESTPVNERFFALRATDQDTGANAQISYDILDGNEGRIFGVFPDGYIFVQNPLDREKQDYFSLTIRASDGGNPPRSSTVSLVVHVVDENDNPPKFTNSTFTFFIDENEGPDTYIGKFSAVDADDGKNAELKYMIASPQMDLIVGPKSGFLKTLRAFDREQLVLESGQDFMSFEVIVRDGGAIPLQDSAQLRVYVRDVNDNEPKFSRNLYSAQISEGTPLGSQVLRVLATDADEGLNGDVVYGFGEGTAPEFEDVFKIDPQTGQISTTRLLDRESQAQYTLIVVAKDLGQNPLSSSATVVVDLTDENDCVPEFTQSEPHIAILETTPVLKELIRFQASDPDLGLNQQVYYSITGGNRQEVFRIDPKSGTLYLNKPLDYERFSSYTLNITASDMGNPKLSSYVEFLVQVIDENDCAPQFPSTDIVRQVQEGIPINSPIVTVCAEDPDFGLNGLVKYSISEQDPPGPYFGINADQGIIFTLKEIDREFTDVFRITVVATDQALPESLRRSTEKLVTVIVEDMNDNAPDFVTLNAAKLSKGMTKGNEIIKMSALDPDSESNGIVTYEMTNGDSTLFSLDRNSGSLSLRRKILDLQPRYQITIKATDEAIQSQRKSTDFYLTIISVSDKDRDDILSFSNSTYNGIVAENEPAGTPILTVAATQKGKSTEDGLVDIEYYITNITSRNGKSQERFFDIDLRRGVISTARVIDREMGVATFFLEVYAILISAKGLHTTSTKVEIEITDQNDSPPKFVEKKIRLNVSESAPVGHPIASITAKDEDTLGTVSYSILQGDGGKFNLNTKTGVLSVLDVLDRETTEEYKIIIQASDGVQHSETTVLVQVTDTNDHPPSFLESIYSFDIPEDAPHGYEVGGLKATDPDKDENGLVTYSVLSDWANDAFSLNSQTGIITLTTRLDYEDVQHYIFIVQAQDSGRPSLSSTASVYFNVIDLNDNAPTFDPMSYNKEIFENVPVGSSIVTVSATDLDSGANGRISYQMASGDEDVFGISGNGTIFTKVALDRETKGIYSIVVRAEDHGTPPLSSSAHVGITLRDVNDCEPMFISPNGTFVTENLPVNTVILVVKAVDRDEGRNSYVEYRLNNENSTFSLGPIDGLLRIVGTIDREARQNYTLRVTARDRGEPSKSSTQQLIVTVLDENDSSPDFDSRQYNAAIPENTPVGVSVLQVTASDMDEGVNSQLRYSILSGDPNRDFSIGEDSGILRVSKNLNFERRMSYTLTVRVEDSGEKVRYDTCTVFITITNVNDNPPVFLDSPYLAFIRENMETNSTPVLRVRAYDADAATKQDLRYLMKEGDKGTFKVNAVTGEITVHRALDREEQSHYLLTILAQDTGTPRLTGTGVILINVVDTNDNSPRFSQDQFEFQIPENTPIGVTVSQLIATDKDSGLNGQVKYKLFGASPFIINEDTGELIIDKEIDRELQEMYRLHVMASDCDPISPRVSPMTNVTIKILDQNDNIPQFERTEYTVTIPDNTGIGNYVLGASATDRDSGINSRIRYYIGGHDADKFQISQSSGVVKALKNLKATGKSTFYLEIQAMDSAVKDPLSSMISVEINLADSSRFPKIRPGKRDYSFSEDAKSEFITTIQASSSRTRRSLETRFNYYIGGGNLGNAFEVGETSGKVKISDSGLDYELAQNYELWIEVSTTDEPDLRSVVSLHINVTDVNDMVPAFEKNVYQLSVPEEENWPKLIATLQATDMDSGDNGKLTYQFSRNTSQTLGSLFGIEASTGKLFTKAKLDREEIPQYVLIVEAVDQGTPRLTGSATVVLSLEDKNDNPPRFSRLFSVNVTENVPIGTFLLQATTVDKDQNANCTYSFTGNTDDKFAIDPISGNITVTGMLDRELKDEYQLRVAAVDGSWRAETLVTVTIQDENDNSPEFEYSFYSFNIPEGDQSVSFIGQVTASDRDKKGPNSLVSYGLKQPSDIFSVNTVSGEIFSRKPLKYKRNLKKWSPENEYRLIVTANDMGKPPSSSECSVVINVVDSINHPPAFEHTSYFVPVLQSSSKGSKIIQIRASDTDDYGVNAELEYLSISGNGSLLFGIEKQTGWVTVLDDLSNKNLKAYVMQVRVTDKGIPPQSSDVPVKFVVVGPNLYPPVFTALSYRVIVPENEILGTVIVTVTASDKDGQGPNGQVRYNISAGNEQGKFAIDSTTGAVTIRQELDYDTKKEYNLRVRVHDLGSPPQSSEAQLMIVLTDMQDNPPRFKQQLYKGYIKENLPPGTEVMKLLADDKDSAKFAVIHYTIIGGSGKTLFRIEPTTGVIYTKHMFDFEERRVFGLEILASNPDSNLYGTTQVQIFVEGVNEYFPKFLQPVFHFTVSEAAAITSVVGTVQATDEDSGDDGIVLFLFVGSSIDKGFSIDSKTGIITVARRLDRESQSRVVLTVLAKNIGPIRGKDTDEAQVIITITDGNDAPIFENDKYEMEISEDAPIGSRVGVVKANDIDVRPPNNRFLYEIQRGNKNGSFRIDQITGLIYTAGVLDTEVDALYTLVIGAVDAGEPPETGTTIVTVTIKDINDNGPTLSSTEGSIPENEPAQSKIMTLHATDPDKYPNGEPFIYTLIDGPDSSRVKINPKTGLITSTTSFDRESTPVLVISVEIQDSGSPPMKSIQEVRINITDKNDNPSSPRNAQIILYTFNDQIPLERIAVIEPSDLDTTGQYNCHLERNENIFGISSNCNLHLKKFPNYPKQSLIVVADDGKHAEVTSSIMVEFLSFDNQTLKNSAVVRGIGLTPEKFVEKVYTKLIGFLKQVLRYTPYIYNIIPNSNGTDILLAVRSGNDYEETENIVNNLLSHKTHISNIFGTEIILNYSPCADQENSCLNGALCSQHLRVYSKPRISESPNLIFSSPAVEQEISCLCPSGFTGAKCELKTEPCQPNPCEEKGTCTKIGLDFHCTCPPHLYGKRCELERSNNCESNPCKNGGSCQENRQDGTYFCLCRPGYFGSQCQTATDTCKPNPCLNGGECISGFSSSSAYPRCRCPTHYYGRHCEKSSYGFGFASFMDFPPLDPNTNDITIVFSTNKENSLLAYNFGEQTGGRSDFVAIELVRGKITLSFGGARTAIATVSVDRYVADGRWYRAMAIRNSRVISLSVAECDSSGENCRDCLPDDSSCYADDVGLTGTLNFNGNPLNIGGIRSVNTMLERPGQIHADDFVGCIHSVEVNGRPLNLSSPLDSRSVSDTCGRAQNVCDVSNHKCGANGECIDKWDSFMCRCGGILASNCDEAFSPYTFGSGSSLEFRIGENYRRNQLLQNVNLESESITVRTISFSFRTFRDDGVLFYAATNKDYTLINFADGKLKYSTRIGAHPPIELILAHTEINDGEWHSVQLTMQNQILHFYVDNEKRMDDLNSASAHEFLDAYLTAMMLGGVDSENVPSGISSDGFEGCMVNFTINDKLQPLREAGGFLDDVIQHGAISRGCNRDMNAMTSVPNTLNIGVSVVIGFFVILLILILVSFFVFRLRKREKSPLPSLPGSASKQSPMSQNDVVRSHMENESETLRNLVRNSKKLNETNLGYQKPDVIERTSNPSLPHHCSTPKNPSNMDNGISMEPDVPELLEHYDLENASSIAPSDIDIVYHYKGFRDNVGSRNKSSPFRHSHHFPGSRQSPGIRQNLVSNGMKSTPLARLSPSSELSQQTAPRILTLQDISGKPLQSALLATSQKDVMSQSERSLNISPSSSRSSIVNAPCQGPKKKRKKCDTSGNNIRIGLTAEEIERLNHPRHKNNSSLVSTLDAVSSSDSNNGRKNKLSELLETNTEIMRRSRDTSSDGGESGNDSFTCSEFEYDNDKRNNIRSPHMMFSKMAGAENPEGEESFRGSLSTLVASDEDITYISSYKKGTKPGERRSGEAWDYLLNWGPNYSPLASVFKDISELPDSGSSARLPEVPPSSLNNLSTVSRNSRYPTPRPNEEYV